MNSCLFCGSAGPSTTEHVLPKWARRDFDIHGTLTLWAGEVTAEPARRKVAKLPQLNVTLRHRICQTCNNDFLSQLETSARPILSPMMLTAEPTVLDAAQQAMLATWAVKTALLFELSFRQNYPASRPIVGYAATAQEFAWLWAERRPPPRSLVWLGCWDCQSRTPVMYEPSEAPLPTDGHPVVGHLTTFSLGFVVFQVFTVDFVAADRYDARSWNTRVPRSLEASLARIWPAPAATIHWPPRPFTHNEWARLVTWDGVLRPGDPFGQSGSAPRAVG